MDWSTITDIAVNTGYAVIPYIATIAMVLISAVFYQLTGLLPGFIRSFADKAYRDKEADMRRSIEQALLNGLRSAVNKGASGPDALTAAINHAMKTNPEGVQHFMRTSGMTRDTLRTQAMGLAEGVGVVWQPSEKTQPGFFAEPRK